MHSTIVNCLSRTADILAESVNLELAVNWAGYPTICYLDQFQVPSRQLAFLLSTLFSIQNLFLLSESDYHILLHFLPSWAIVRFNCECILLAFICRLTNSYSEFQ